MDSYSLLKRNHLFFCSSPTCRIASTAQPNESPTHTCLPQPTTLCWNSHFHLPHSNLNKSTSTHSKRLSTMSLTLTKCLTLLQTAIPPLDGLSYKGQSGKLAIIGGSKEYTGAPYFAAMSAMRAGAELCFIYCDESAAPAIKAYSPDLIVYPGFHFLGNECNALNRMHALVLGPGLGRDEAAAEVTQKVVEYAARENKPIVIDADALWFVSQSGELRETIRNAPDGFVAYLTPNRVEMDRLNKLCEMVDGKAVVEWFNGRVVLVEKGRFDNVSGKNGSVQVSSEGSLKRVGGQGDFLAGLVALFATWMKHSHSCEEEGMAAAVCACLLTRAAAKGAFEKHGRSLLASDIFPFIGPALDDMLSKNASLM